METVELAAWLRLTTTPGVGRDSVRRLLASYGDPLTALDAGASGWRHIVAPAVADALARPPVTLPALIDDTRAWLEGDASRRILTLGDPGYPEAWLQTADPPNVLYTQGRLPLLKAPSLAVVGSRHATAQGLDNARAFARHLSGQGLTIVSGLASGIDGAAHEGALEGRGSTVAIVGTGLDRVYPKAHLALARRVAAQGLLVSEYPLGSPALAGHFPQRNRLIAGLSLGTLVVEAAVQSGSLITARLATEAGREVFAIPGSIHAPQSRGAHLLIKQGAKLVETADDVLQELRMPTLAAGPAATPADASGAEAPVLDAMGHDPITLDSLGARTGMGAAELSAKLLTLELDGLVARLPGGLFQRRGAA